MTPCLLFAGLGIRIYAGVASQRLPSQTQRR
jgi:hypothetical protein